MKASCAAETGHPAGTVRPSQPCETYTLNALMQHKIVMPMKAKKLSGKYSVTLQS